MKARLYGLLCLMVTFWSLNFIVGKYALQELPALMVASLRATLSAIFILPLYLLRGEDKEHAAWRLRDVPLLGALGVLGVVLNQVFFVLGLSRTSVGHSSILIGMGPLLVLLIAAAVGQERITRWKLVGIACAAAGVLVLQSGKGSGPGPTLTGDLLVFLASLTFSLFTVFSKDASARFGALTLNTIAYTGGALVMLPLTIWESWQHPLTSISAAAWWSVAYMALCPSVLAYLMYSYALKSLPASRVSAFSYLQPVIAIALAAVLFREIPGGGFLAGSALVLGGVYITERG